MNMPKIQKCSATECAYNKEQQCHALAITVGDAKHPACDTFFRISKKGGDPQATAGVGACKVTSCKFNESLECQARGIEVGKKKNEVDCLTFQPQ